MKGLKLRILAVVTAMAMVVLTIASVPVTASAEEVVASGSCGDNLTWSLDNAGLLTITGTGAMTDWGGLSASYAPWVDYRDSIKTVAIGVGVTSIGRNAFDNCTNLAAVTISDSVSSIGRDAFFRCTSLTAITIPEGITSIGHFAFRETSLTAVTLPKSLTRIGFFVFDDCTNLTSVTFRNTIPPQFISPDFKGGSDDSFVVPFTVYVPKGSKSAYQEAFQVAYKETFNFKSFTIKIVELCPDFGKTDKDCACVPQYVKGNGKPHPIAFARGDVNNNGKTDIQDALEILKYLAKMNSAVTGNNAKWLNNGNAVTITNALEILKYLAKMKHSLNI